MPYNKGTSTSKLAILTSRQQISTELSAMLKNFSSFLRYGYKPPSSHQ
jgi:hypothetical protein